MNKLTKFFVGSIILLVAFVLLSAPDVKRVKRALADFHVNASDRLYFKNLRQYYYRSSTTKGEQFEVFTLKQADTDLQSPLRFKILNNWRMDEAYIMLTDTADVTLGKVILDGTVMEPWDLQNLDGEGHMQLAMDLFEHLQDDGNRCFYDHPDLGRMELWSDKAERQRTLTVLKDYFKLVGAL